MHPSQYLAQLHHSRLLALLLASALALFACNDDPSGPIDVIDPPSPVPLACADYTPLFQGWNSLPLESSAVALEVTDAEILLATADSTLHVLSLPEFSQPQFLDSQHLGGPIRDIAWGNGFVAAARDLDGIALFALGPNGELTPAAPWTDGSPVTEVEASDSTLVAIGGGRLRVLRVDDAGGARLLGVEDISLEASMLRWDAPIAAVRTVPNGGIQLYALVDPTDPVPSGYLNEGSIQDYEVGAGFLIRANCPFNGSNAVQVLELKNPSSRASGRVNIENDCIWSVEKDAGRFYMVYERDSDGIDALYEFEPRRINRYWQWSSVTPMNGHPPLIEVRNDMVYTAEDALEWAGLNRPASSAILGVWPYDGGFFQAGFRNDVLFGVSVNLGLEAIDISDPNDLRELGRIRADGASGGLQIGRRYVYFGSNYSKLVTVDTQDPAAMIWASELELDYTIFEIGARGSLFYVDHHERGISIVNVSDPLRLRKVGHIPPPNWKPSMRVFGDLMVLLNHLGGGPAAAISDISDPLNPTEFIPFGGSNPRWQDAVYDASRKILFLIGWQIGVIAYDVSNPLAPSYVGQFVGNGSVWRVAFHENRIYMVETEGIVVLDVTNPAAMVEVDRLPGKDMYSVATNGSALYLTRINDALRAFRMPCQN